MWTNGSMINNIRMSRHYVLKSMKKMDNLYKESSFSFKIRSQATRGFQHRNLTILTKIQNKNSRNSLTHSRKSSFVYSFLNHHVYKTFESPETDDLVLYK